MLPIDRLRHPKIQHPSNLDDKDQDKFPRDQQYLTIRKQALVKLRKALNETLDIFGDIKNKDSYVAVSFEHLQSSFKEAIEKLQDHFSNYESSVAAFEEVGESSSRPKNKKRKGPFKKTTRATTEISSSTQSIDEKIIENGYCANNESWEALDIWVTEFSLFVSKNRRTTIPSR
ncbi:7730_t:CDS:2, partial [Dentiscutata erythropus]